MKTLRLLAAAIVLVACPLMGLSAQSAEPDEAQLRTWAKEAATFAKTDPTVFKAIFQGRVKSVMPTYEPFIPINLTDGVVITASGPTGMFQTLLTEQFRKFEPLDKVPFEQFVGVTVSPDTLNSPDIIKVVVVRNAQAPINATRSMLIARDMTNAMGAKTSKHAGTAYFSLDVFASDAKITIIAVPESGANIIKDLTPAELARLR